MNLQKYYSLVSDSSGIWSDIHPLNIVSCHDAIISRHDTIVSRHDTIVSRHTTDSHIIRNGLRSHFCLIKNLYHFTTIFFPRTMYRPGATVTCLAVFASVITSQTLLPSMRNIDRCSAFSVRIVISLVPPST